MRPSVVEVRDLPVQGRPARQAPRAGRGKVSLSVGQGEVHAVLGGYGSGKTTLLETIAGLRPHTSGTVEVKGGGPVPVWREGGLFSGLTVTEVVDAWRRWTLDPLTRADALRLTGLTDRASVAFERLDDAERRLLDLTLALVGRSDLLLLDEPFTGLDGPSADRVWGVLRSLADEGTAVLFTTREIDEACRADRVTVLDGALPVPARARRAA
ncbi:ATP-binding cassette domain-containing protein [Actinomadura logoneensis]|uniref:ATP-binding cassette domain-containing protein n=2 Tax=Actinomadura logoneensis TaxID=2293572 RepID=A0A372JA52_9ACTN|nr:ATP-binding cassette domain-containing protein [Actinomadura logoneensis]